MLKIKGRIVKGGQPFIVAKDESMRIRFIPTEPLSTTTYDSFYAIYNRDDGSFRVTGKDGNGLPPGKYRVDLELMKARSDAFHGAYTGKWSPDDIVVNNSTGEVVIDLDKKLNPS
jgi:hypothetical protein